MSESIICRNCGSGNIRRNGGKFNTKSGLKSRWKCLECDCTFTVLEEQKSKAVIQKSPKSLVITSVINNSKVNKDFLDVLNLYCSENDAVLYAIPVRHKNVGEPYVDEFDSEISDCLLDHNLEYPDYKFKIFGSLKLSASLENPLSGLDPMTKGDTLVVGHPQVQLKTLPRFHDKYPPILTTTGTLSEKVYSNSKPGIKANFNHSLSALIVEFDSVNNEKFVHIRHLNFDDKNKGFYDIDKWYSLSGVETSNSVKALITGDEHAIFTDESVKAVTYDRQDSIVNTLRPEKIIRHDILDCYSITHHDRKNFLNRFKKHSLNQQFIEKELDKTVDYINSTTPHWTTSYIIQSNHNEHLERWLNECDPKTEPWNAKIYHKLMYDILLRIEEGEPYDPFELYASEKTDENVVYLSRLDNLEIDGILLGAHGDIGINGSKGSRDQFSTLPEKTVIGHSHSPGIEKGCYQVGTSSKLRLGYNDGSPSSWHHCHCIIHQNGKRQLLFITHDKFRK